MENNQKIRITLFEDWGRFKELSYRHSDSIQQVEKCNCGKSRPVCYVSLKGEILEKYTFCPECAKTETAGEVTEKNKSFKYKGWLCEWRKDEQLYYLFTPDELDNPKDMRYQETEISTQREAKEFINNY